MPEPKRMGRPALPPDQRTSPRTVWMTDAEWAKIQSAPKGWVRRLVQRMMNTNLEPIGWLPCMPDGTPHDPKEGLFDSEEDATWWSPDVPLATAVYSHAQLVAAIAAERERSDALRTVLRVIVEQDPIDLALDPEWSQRIAKGGLDATRSMECRHETRQN